MSQLAEFLYAKQPLFDLALEQLERRTGHPGIDAALAADMATRAATKTRLIGLAPDCDGPDLYEALIHQVKLHDAHLARQIGGHDPSDVRQMLPLIAKTARAVDTPRSGFFIKEEVAAEMLKRRPPEAIMERLGYDQVSKMAAKEDLAEIFLALRFAQDPDWLNEFNELYRDLSASDFVARDIRLIEFDPDKWGDIAAHFIKKKLHNIANSKEMGAIGMMPMSISRMPGITLKDIPLIMHYFNELRLYSAYFKLMRAKRNFGEIVATTLIADPSAAKIEGQHIHWRVIQRYFGKLKNEHHPEIFEPHLQPEDLHWRRAEAILYEIDPELEFWRDLDWVGLLRGDDTVTFNLMDISLSYSNQLKYQDRYLYHFRESLWNEIFARYFGQKILEEQLLVKLDNDVIKPEALKISD